MARWGAGDMPDLSGKRAVVTGATHGIGFEIAAAFAAAGAAVVLTGRNPANGAASVAALRERHPRADAVFALADQADLGSIAAFAEREVTSGAPLDFLVNNAGVMGLPQRQLTEQGFEMHFGVNHLGHFALTALLLPALLRASTPRVTTVSSLTHRRARLDFDDLQAERGYASGIAYAQSKLANLMFALELARRITRGGSKLASNAAHPGFARTHLFALPSLGSVRLAATLFAQPAARGAVPVLFAATSFVAHNSGYYGPDGWGEIHGGPQPARIASQARDEAAAGRLWEVSERLTGITFPPLI
jgi:NAD(P)-dependent dehydrogenase (short-subunit alcohol dehydrogenase family)